MSDQEKLGLHYKALEDFPAAMTPDQVAAALGISRRTVDRLLDENKIEFFSIGAEGNQRQAKRVSKAALIEYMSKGLQA